MRPELECAVQVLSRLQYAARFRSSPRTPGNGANDEGTLQYEKKGGDEVGPSMRSAWQIWSASSAGSSRLWCRFRRAASTLGGRLECRAEGSRLPGFWGQTGFAAGICMLSLCVSVSVFVRLCLYLCLHLHLCQHLRLTLRLTVSMCLLELVT